MKFYFLNWVQLSYYFGKVVPSGSTQGKVCHAITSITLTVGASIVVISIITIFIVVASTSVATTIFTSTSTTTILIVIVVIIITFVIICWLYFITFFWLMYVAIRMASQNVTIECVMQMMN